VSEEDPEEDQDEVDGLNFDQFNDPDGGDDPSAFNNQNSIQRGINAYKKNNIVSKTYLKQKALNYQKKRSGTGGGFI
jgi:hypothetical protein